MSSEEILSFDIVIDTRLSEGTKKTLEELKSVDEDLGGPPADISGVQDEAKELLLAEEELAQIQSVLNEQLGGLDKADIVQFGLLAKNPGAVVSRIMTKLLTSRAAAIMGPLAIAVAAPIVMVEIIKALSVKGGPLNRDWRRFIGEEIAVGLSREQDKEDEFGVSQTILTQVHRFLPNNENWTYNSLFDVNDSRIARIGLTDREAGVTMFIP